MITKTEADGTSQQWTNYDETSRYRDCRSGRQVLGPLQAGGRPTPGSFSPRSVPTPMVEPPEGGTLKVSWGEASGGPGSFLAKYGEGDYNIITATDLRQPGLHRDRRRVDREARGHRREAVVSATDRRSLRSTEVP